MAVVNRSGFKASVWTLVRIIRKFIVLSEDFPIALVAAFILNEVLFTRRSLSLKVARLTLIDRSHGLLILNG